MKSVIQISEVIQKQKKSMYWFFEDVGVQIWRMDSVTDKNYKWGKIKVFLQK